MYCVLCDYIISQNGSYSLKATSNKPGGIGDVLKLPVIESREH